jgi:L-lactate dehydrogenase
MKITLIGFGEVGSLVGALINNSYENIDINVINTQTTKSGRILDLEHAAAIRNNFIYHNNKSEHKHADLIIYSAGFSNAHGESRNSVAQKNKELVFSIFGNMHYSKNQTIIVITNPVEPISFWINKVVGDKARVIGTGTALDTFRLKYILSKKFNCPAGEIDCLVIGEHGQHMVPLYSRAYINGRNLSELCNDDDLAEITDKLIHSAFQIRETEKATKYGIAETTLFLMRSILSEKLTISSASFGEPGNWKDFLRIDKPMYISLPYQINKFGLTPVFFELAPQEKLALQRAVNSISDQII